MPKVNIKKKSTIVDMTAMTDVAFLLLTFFMLTSNFTKKDAVMVSTPSSVSEIKIPERNIMTVLINPDGKVFMGIDGQAKRIELLEKMGEVYNIKFTNEMKKVYSMQNTVGVPMSAMAQFLGLPDSQREEWLADQIKHKGVNVGIPTDSANNEFANWIKASRAINRDLRIAIKADQTTPYLAIKNVMNTLQDLKENRYNLITSLEAAAGDLVGK